MPGAVISKALGLSVKSRSRSAEMAHYPTPGQQALGLDTVRPGLSDMPLYQVPKSRPNDQFIFE